LGEYPVFDTISLNPIEVAFDEITEAILTADLEAVREHQDKPRQT
jgi:hypothetical protein